MFTRDERTALVLFVLIPLMVLWLLLLFAPSGGVALGARVSGGILATGLFVPLMAVRIRNR